MTEEEKIQQSCREGTHVTIPVIKEKRGLFFAAECCSRLFTLASGPSGVFLAEVGVDHDKLEQVRTEWAQGGNSSS